MSKLIKKIVESIPSPDIDLKKNYKSIRKVQEIAKSPKIKPLYKFWDFKVNVKGYEVPVRMFKPNKEKVYPVIIYFHGGGWVLGNIDTYTKFCHALANETNHIVLSVDYRLAPEWKFPVGLNDCYQVVKDVLKNTTKLKISKQDITLMGDSAGANIAAAVSLRRRDRLQFNLKKQVLIYPAVEGVHKTNMYPSVKKYKDSIALSLKEINDYMDLYKKTDKDLTNPYLAPMNSFTFRKQPDTLIITAELDILRDEGEEYGKRLKKAGNSVRIERIADAPHGYLTSFPNSAASKKTIKIINEFLSKE